MAAKLLLTGRNLGQDEADRGTLLLMDRRRTETSAIQADTLVKLKVQK